MKLQKDFTAILFHSSQRLQKFFIDAMMTENILAQLSSEDVIMRRDAMENIANSYNNKIYYITNKVQEHAKLIKFDKIDLGWFRNLKTKHATYILNKKEFFRFWINEEKSLHIGYFRVDDSYGDVTLETITNGQIPPSMKGLEKFPMIAWDVFVIRLKDYPNGYMPIIPGQDIDKQKFFVQLLMFIELSGVIIHQIAPNQKINLNPGGGRNFDNKIKNESGTNVTLVDTSWNKTLIVAGEFAVSGHLRIQPCGHKRQDYKFAWIEEYKKSGYIRRAPKLNDSSVD